MYWDKKRNRTLLRNGCSVLTPYEFSLRILKGEDFSRLYVENSEESQAYDLVYHEKTSKEISAIDVNPQSHDTSEEDFEYVIRAITSSDRYSDTMDERIAVELDYFYRTKNVTFLRKCIDLITSFQRDGVVWGVGRGSSCASVIMFLIKVNDINPLDHDIPFSELSKEQEFDG